MTDAMIDLETLAISEDATIASIGLVLFDRDDHNKPTWDYLWRINLNQNRKIDPDTVKWWLKQDRQAIVDTFEGETVSLAHALNNLHNIIKDFKVEYVWANSPAFDLSALKHAYTQHNIKCPWTFRQEMDVRTLGNSLKIYSIPIPKKEGTLHNPVVDCKNQIKIVHLFYKDYETNEGIV